MKKTQQQTPITAETALSTVTFHTIGGPSGGTSFVGETISLSEAVDNADIDIDLDNLQMIRIDNGEAKRVVNPDQFNDTTLHNGDRVFLMARVVGG